MSKFGHLGEPPESDTPDVIRREPCDKCEAEEMNGDPSKYEHTCEQKPVSCEQKPKTVNKEIWRHYKGGFYEVIAVAKRESDAAELVLYAKCDGDGTVWVRPLSEWNETMPNGKQRYTRVSYACHPGDIAEDLI